MALLRKTYNTTEGTNIVSTELVYVKKIHWISRSDKIYSVYEYDLSGFIPEPKDLDVFHDNASGQLLFRTNFTNGEKINVVYEV